MTTQHVDTESADEQLDAGSGGSRWRTIPARFVGLALRHPPLTAFLILYVVTAYAGAIALLAGPTALRAWYVSRTAAQMPSLSTRTVLMDLALLNIAPLLLGLGWSVAGAFSRRRPAPRSLPARPKSVHVSLFATSTAVFALEAYLMARVAQSGALSDISGWFGGSGGVLVGRYAVFKTLSYWDFVAAYTLLPLLIGVLISQVLIERPRDRRAAGLAIAAGLGFVAVDLMLFQKRPLFVGILAIAIVVFTRIRGHGRLPSVRRFPVRTVALVVAGVVALYAVYAVLLLAPSSGGTGSDRSLVMRSEFAQLGPVGWATGGGFVNHGARLGVTLTSPAALQVTTEKGKQGVNYSTGLRVAPGSRWQLTLDVSTHTGGQRLDLLLGTPTVEWSQITAKGPPGFKRYVLTWTAGHSGVMEIGIRTRRAGRFALADVQLRRVASSSSGSHQASTGSLPAGTILGSVSFPTLAKALSSSRLQGFALLAVLAPLTRTAGPAIAYPALYPAHHSYYRLDLGLDLLSVGSAPDDNASSFKLLFPAVSGGSNSVPFMFGLYSEGGLLIALVVALVVGMAWNLAWVRVAKRSATVTGACGMALAVIFGILIAGDSVRNALLSSYGVLPPAVAIAAVAFLAGLLRSTRAAMVVAFGTLIAADLAGNGVQASHGVAPPALGLALVGMVRLWRPTAIEALSQWLTTSLRRAGVRIGDATRL